jgi:hypothetical protein
VTIARRPALRLALVLGAIDVVLVTWSEPLFGRWWKYVMWEGGLIEDLSAVFFIVGALGFATCAWERRHPGAHRRWFVVYALAMLMLAGEETNYGRGTLFLDLADPDFAANYNPQGGNIHNVIFPHAFIPIALFFGICAALRMGYHVIVPRLGLPIRKDFLDAVLVTALFVIAMVPSFWDDRWWSIDEVYEWSSSLLLLCLALSYRFGWIFRPRAGEAEPITPRASPRARPGGRASSSASSR